MNLKRFVGDKDFYKKALFIAIPLMLQQLISTSVNLLDNLMIGQLGDHALSGVATVNRYFIIAVFGTNGVIAASAVFMAQFFGARDEEHMKQTFRFSILTSMLIMSTFVILALLFPGNIIRFFVKDPKVIEQGMRYIYVCALAFIPNLFTLSIAGSMRATGDSKTPLVASVISMITNFCFNYCLIYGNFGAPRLGVLGGAIGTFIARCVELTFISYFLVTGNYAFKTRIRDMFDISRTLVKRITAKAFPLALNEVLWASGMALLLRLYATRGAEVISGYSIATTVSDMFFTMNAGMSVAITILVSQPLGANKLDEARENGYRLLGFGVILSAVFGTLLLGSTFMIPKIYSVSAEAMWTAQTFLRIQAPLFSIYVINTTCYFILRAGGDTRSTLMLDSGYMWCVNLVAVGVATYTTDLSILWLYIIGQSTDVLKMMLALRFVNKEKWIVNLAEEEKQEEALILEFES
ncbi:MATE family efflux transporter [Erysipelothrix rhusiopathiae]|nr:MATE family efflux transporter [Erysipelothrix rhusiopathiae]MDE8125890.1 MATE family efflux transporter [Erysipelothrix rhusiopathiae]MDE8129236.1 MATE family efflux transporter [Erysipelothrix rhusiopathiae]MDE8150726.1 MATE family efflux transporter [Erysipelothrix rhusiopathiae]MDE8153827.1 MATE family efflux transporter [Erysipelothrix rhusiopathiae]